MKILLLLDVAPNYRELFLRKLGDKCDLTVLAHSCEKDNLVPPDERKGYTYIELDKEYGKRLRFNFELNKYIKSVKPDLICANLNFRYPVRIRDFFFQKYIRNKTWVWWGPFFGNNSFLNPLKRFMGRLADGNLVYMQSIADKLPECNVLSFNNSQHSSSQFVPLENKTFGKLHCLFVGRAQERKRLERIIEIAKRRTDVLFRLVGPNMKDYFAEIEIPDAVSLYPSAYGDELVDHFKWSNLVVNPGHVGLLVMNAATHNRPIVINSGSDHAPEVLLAKEAEQFFIDFGNKKEVDQLIDKLVDNPELLSEKGRALYDIAKSKYTVEHMMEVHIHMFRTLLNPSNS